MVYASPRYPTAADLEQLLRACETRRAGTRRAQRATSLGPSRAVTRPRRGTVCFPHFKGRHATGKQARKH
jgi:hypothetical protein